MVKALNFHLLYKNPKTFTISMSKNDFFKRVYSVVKTIPEGRVTTYGLIAKKLGTAKSSRTVGWALLMLAIMTHQSLHIELLIEMDY